MEPDSNCALYLSVHICMWLSLSLPTLLLAYLTNQPFPTLPISGNTSAQQLLENIQAGDVVVRADTLRYLERGDN
jgi:aryl-alcohol dehydrogenase-like predicted oxidoreductase